LSGNDQGWRAYIIRCGRKFTVGGSILEKKMATLAERLKPFVPEIQNSAAVGDTLAQQIINLYQMFCACPSDPGAPALCEATFEDWLKTRQDPQEVRT